MPANDEQRKSKHSESVTTSPCTWQTTDCLCHGNAHNCLVSAMQRRHCEKWKIPKERALYPRDCFLLEIESAFDCIFFNIRTPVNYTPVILLLLLLPPHHWCYLYEEDREFVRTAPAPGAHTVILLFLLPIAPPHLRIFSGERLFHPFANKPEAWIVNSAFILFHYHCIIKVFDIDLGRPAPKPHCII